MQKLTLAIL